MESLLEDVGTVRVVVHPDVPGAAATVRDLEGRLGEGEQVVLVVLPASQGPPEPVAAQVSDRLGPDWVVAVAAGPEIAAVGPSLPKGEAARLAEVAEDLSNTGENGLGVFTYRLHRDHAESITVSTTTQAPPVDVGPGPVGLAGGGVVLALAAAATAVLVRRRLRVRDAAPSTPPSWDEDRRDWTAPELRAAVSTWPTVGLSGPVVDALDPVRSDMLEVLYRWDQVRDNPGIAYDVARIALDWVPSLLGLYAGLPVDLRSVPARPGGPSPTMAVLDQLGVLDEHLDHVRQAAYRGSVDELEAQGQFLAERYRRSELDITG